MSTVRHENPIRGILLFFVETHPQWFKRRKKIEQFFLLYSGVSCILFALYPFAKVGLQILEKGCRFQSAPWLSLTVTGYIGAIVAGFIGGNGFLGVYFLIALVSIPIVYRKRFKGSVPGIVSMCFALMFSPLVGMMGIANSPIGTGTRNAYQRIKDKSVPDSQAEVYAKELEKFSAENRNWLTIDQDTELYSQKQQAEARHQAYTKRENERIAEEKRQKEEAMRLSQIADGSYMPSQSDIRPSCERLVEENSLTGRVNWGWFNYSWFPEMKTLILKGKTKNAFGVEIPFSAECRWEKGGRIRLVEISR